MTPLRLLRLAGPILLLGSVASASAETVKERIKNDPGFRIYAVIFGVTATTKSTPPAIRMASVGDASTRPARGADVARIIPDAWIKAAKKKIQAESPQPKMKDGKPVEVFTYFFYVPEHPNIVVSDLDKPLDKQP
jgi:hypothetical protein